MFINSFFHLILFHLLAINYCHNNATIDTFKFKDGIDALKSRCNLELLGKKYTVDKVDNKHRYQGLYCTLFEPIRYFSLDMLEIGFGCHHRVNGRGALMWTRY